MGSNLGDRDAYLRQAIQDMTRRGIHLSKLSSIIETDPVGGPLQEKYLNCVIKCKTDFVPVRLLQITQKIEKNLGRVRTVMNGPRTIDIDILLYDDLQVEMPILRIPHPRMLEREFVLLPLAEIAPDVVEKLTHAHH